MCHCKLFRGLFLLHSYFPSKYFQTSLFSTMTNNNPSFSTNNHITFNPTASSFEPRINNLSAMGDTHASFTPSLGNQPNESDNGLMYGAHQTDEYQSNGYNQCYNDNGMSDHFNNLTFSPEQPFVYSREEECIGPDGLPFNMPSFELDQQFVPYDGDDGDSDFYIEVSQTLATVLGTPGSVSEGVISIMNSFSSLHQLKCWAESIVDFSLHNDHFSHSAAELINGTFHYLKKNFADCADPFQNAIFVKLENVDNVVMRILSLHKLDPSLQYEKKDTKYLKNYGHLLSDIFMHFKVASDHNPANLENFHFLAPHLYTLLASLMEVPSMVTPLCQILRLTGAQLRASFVNLRKTPGGLQTLQDKGLTSADVDLEAPLLRELTALSQRGALTVLESNQVEKVEIYYSSLQRQQNNAATANQAASEASTSNNNNLSDKCLPGNVSIIDGYTYYGGNVPEQNPEFLHQFSSSSVSLDSNQN